MFHLHPSSHVQSTLALNTKCNTFPFLFLCSFFAQTSESLPKSSHTNSDQSTCFDVFFLYVLSKVLAQQKLIQQKNNLNGLTALLYVLAAV